MPNSMQGPQSRENQTAITTGWIANAIVASLPVLACFLAGATQKWEEGVVITVLAFCLLVRPPRFSLGVITNLVLFTLFILAAVALLPPTGFSNRSGVQCLKETSQYSFHQHSLRSRGSR